MRLGEKGRKPLKLRTAHGVMELYLLMTIGFIPIVLWAMTLLMPLRATIFAFMIGSVMVSKSTAKTHKQQQQTSVTLHVHFHPLM